MTLVNDLGSLLLLGKAALFLGAVVAVAAAVYILRTAIQPLLWFLQFLIAYTPGERPSDIVAGLLYGVRIVVWAAVLGIAAWFFLKRGA